MSQSVFYVFGFDLKIIYLDGVKECGVKESWYLGFVGKTKMMHSFSLVSFLCSWGKEKKHVHVHTSVNNRILIPKSGKQL